MMRRDFVFILKGVNKNLLIYGDNVYSCQFTEDESQNRFLQFLQRRLGSKNWAGAQPVSIFITRTDVAESDDAFEIAFDRVSGAADIYDTLAEDGVDIASFFGIREGDAPDAELYVFAKNQGRFRVHSKD